MCSAVPRAPATLKLNHCMWALWSVAHQGSGTMSQLMPSAALAPLATSKPSTCMLPPSNTDVTDTPLLECMEKRRGANLYSSAVAIASITALQHGNTQCLTVFHVPGALQGSLRPHIGRQVTQTHRGTTAGVVWRRSTCLLCSPSAGVATTERCTACNAGAGSLQAQVQDVRAATRKPQAAATIGCL
jgi:hypothetical protein